MSNASESPWLISYGRCHGRPLRPEQKRLVEELLPKLAVPLVEGSPLQPATLFDFPIQKLWMEIGFGGGEHLAAQAEAHPDIGFIGCEPFFNGTAKLLREIEQRKLTNIRIHTMDARDVLEHLPDGSLDRVFILFPDPWPKKRHHKRRLISQPMLDLLAKKITPGGELRLATDHTDYAAWMLAHLTKHPSFTWLAQTQADWQTPPPGWIPTRYQKKAEAEGRGAVFLRWVRGSDYNQLPGLLS